MVLILLFLLSCADRNGNVYVDVDVTSMSYWRGAVGMYAMSFRALIFVVIVHLRFEFINQTSYLKASEFRIENKTYLFALENLRVKIITFRHVQMRNNILTLFCLEHFAIEVYVVIVLVILFVLEMVDNRQLRRVILDHDLNRHAGCE